MGIRTARTRNKKAFGQSKRAATKKPAKARPQSSFSDVLDAAEELDSDSQLELIAVLKRRLAERGRARVIADVKKARREFAEGRCQVMTPTEIVREALS